VRVLVVVEDDEDVQDLIETVFSLDSRFTLAGVSATAEDALEMARTKKVALIVLNPPTTCGSAAAEHDRISYLTFAL
jgi:response regulator of citrate/malate metabolism